MERDAHPGQAAPSVPPSDATEASVTPDGLLDRIAIIESQPLDARAQGFEQLHDELLSELQRSDHEGVSPGGN